MSGQPDSSIGLAREFIRRKQRRRRNLALVGAAVSKAIAEGRFDLSTAPSYQNEVESNTLESEAEMKYCNWSTFGGNYRPAGAVIKKVPAGTYNIRMDNNGWYLEAFQHDSDELFNLPGLPVELILTQIEKFWNQKDKFESLGLLHKRGILLYGAAGCGKTSIIKLLSNELVARDGIVIVVNQPEVAMHALHDIRIIEPKRPILTIIEDIDIFVDDSMARSELLSLLDGEGQVNHIVHLATTNYPDVLGDTLIKRPGRFDVVIELKAPPVEAREAYLKHILKGQVSDNDIHRLAKETAGLGLSYLRELVSAVYCLGLDMDETLKRLRGDIKLKPRASKVGEESNTGYGIGFGRVDDE